MRLRQILWVVTFWIWQALMITARMEGGQAYLMAIRGMDGELTKVIEEFVRAVDLEALRFAKRGHRSLRARPAKPQNPNNILEFLEGLR